jgi:hypothetical protein
MKGYEMKLNMKEVLKNGFNSNPNMGPTQQSYIGTTTRKPKILNYENMHGNSSLGIL